MSSKLKQAHDHYKGQRILEAAKNDDWQALKGIFEDGDPFDDHLRKVAVNDFMQYAAPYLKKEYNWTDDDVVRFANDPENTPMALSSHAAEGKKFLERKGKDDGGGIALADDLFGSSRLTAIKNIQAAISFQNLAEWFASAFDFGPGFSNGAHGLSDVARNIDAISELAAKLKEAYALYQDQGADLEDRIDAASFINTVANSYQVKLPNGNTVSVPIFEKVTGMELLPVKPLMSGKEYADLKLSEMRDRAKTVAEAAGVDVAASIQKVKSLDEEVTRATQELNEKAAPLCQEYQAKLDAALESVGYNAKKLEAAAIAGRAQMQMDDLGPRPKSYDGWASDEENRALYAQYEEWSAKVQAVHDERDAAFKVLQGEMTVLHQEATAQVGDWNEILAPLNAEYNAFVAKKREEIAQARAEVKKLRDHVLSTSPVTKEAADAWFDSMVLIPKNMQANLKKRGYTPEKLKADMTEFYRITGGRLSRISFETKGGQRAAAQPTTGVVYVAGEFGAQTFWHEMAHVLEDDERTRALSQRFLDQRTGRDQEGGNRVEWLGALTGDKRYGRDEVAYKDSFIDPYVGKYYRHGITEVFSMGMQYFASPEAMATLAEKDPDHFNFMLGYMTTAPRVDTAKVEQQQQAMAAQKDNVETSETFLKNLDKKIAKAGDFWSAEGFTIDSYKSYRGGSRFYASWPKPDESGRFYATPYLKSEKNLKRMLWLHIAAGKPADGPYSLSRLAYDVFQQKSLTIPKEMAQSGLLEA